MIMISFLAKSFISWLWIIVPGMSEQHINAFTCPSFCLSRLHSIHGAVTKLKSSDTNNNDFIVSGYHLISFALDAGKKEDIKPQTNNPNIDTRHLFFISQDDEDEEEKIDFSTTEQKMQQQHDEENLPKVDESITKLEEVAEYFEKKNPKLLVKELPVDQWNVNSSVDIGTTGTIKKKNNSRKSNENDSLFMVSPLNREHAEFESDGGIMMKLHPGQDQLKTKQRRLYHPEQANLWKSKNMKKTSPTPTRTKWNEFDHDAPSYYE